MLRSLIEAGAQMNASDRKGQTPLHQVTDCSTFVLHSNLRTETELGQEKEGRDRGAEEKERRVSRDRMDGFG